MLFDGVDAGGWLTQGEIQVGGDFAVGQTNAANPFYASTNHTVRFSDVSPTQVVSFADPGIAGRNGSRT